MRQRASFIINCWRLRIAETREGGKISDRTNGLGRKEITSNIELNLDLLGFLAALAVRHVLKIHLLPALTLSILRVLLRCLLHSGKFGVVRIVSETRLRTH